MVLQRGVTRDGASWCQLLICIKFNSVGGVRGNAYRDSGRALKTKVKAKEERFCKFISCLKCHQKHKSPSWFYNKRISFQTSCCVCFFKLNLNTVHVLQSASLGPCWLSLTKTSLDLFFFSRCANVNRNQTSADWLYQPHQNILASSQTHCSRCGRPSKLHRLNESLKKSNDECATLGWALK